MLLVLRPFRTGDYIQCGTVAGTVREIGLVSTLLTTPEGIAVSAPNGTLWGAPITNYSRNPNRRLDVAVDVAYSDSIDAGLRALLGAAAAEPRLLAEPAPAAMATALGESAVTLTLRVWTKREDYWNVRFALIRATKLAIQDAGLTIPFPQRDVHVVPDLVPAPPEPR